MDKYLVAAAAVDYLKQLKEEQHQTLVGSINAFMSMAPQVDAVPSQLIDSIYKIGQGQIDYRLECFAKVRGLFGSSMQSPSKEESSQTIFADFERALFEQIAYFEAVAFEYSDSGAMQIDDQKFNASLKLLSALDDVTGAEANDLPDKLTAQASVISLITEYYRGMDHLLAARFNRAHNRRENLVRIGPFSFSTGSLWETLDRPAIVLNPEQKLIFDERVRQTLSRYIYHENPTLRSIIERIGSEPMSLTASY